MEPRPSRDLTRRTLLGGAVAVGAASLVSPAESVAAALGSHPGVFSRWMGSLTGESAVLTTASQFAPSGNT